jgi:hypothetical protein
MHFIRGCSHKFSGVAAGIASSIIILTSSAIAQVQIPGLYATGVDDNGNTLPLGSFDPHYIVKEAFNASAVSISNPFGGWVSRTSPTSAWIWQDSNGQPSVVTRTFQTSFDLTGLDPLTASVSGYWAVDDVGIDILLNGVSTGLTTPAGFFALNPLTLNSGFVSGVNTLDFVAVDSYLLGGFLVSSVQGVATPLNSSTSSVPGPLPLLGIAAAFGYSRKLRKRINPLGGLSCSNSCRSGPPSI